MNLEETVGNEGQGFIATGAGLATSVLTTVGAYNLAGYIASNSDSSTNADKYVTMALLSAGAVIGYKIGSKIASVIVSELSEKTHKLRKKIKRTAARNKTLAQISNDKEFMQEQGIKKGNFGKIRTAARYLLSVPAGGALGYFPGAIGIVPLCVYFGEKYEWSEAAALNSGPPAGAIIGAYAFAEMAAKKQYKRIVTTASALAGVTAGHFFNEGVLDLRMLDKKPDLWQGLGICVAGAIISGTIGNSVYKIIRHTSNRRNKNRI